MSRQEPSLDSIIQLDDKRFCRYVDKQLIKCIRSELHEVENILKGKSNLNFFVPSIAFANVTGPDQESAFFIVEYKKELERAKSKLFYFKFNEQPINDFSEIAIDLLAKMDKAKLIFQENGALEYSKIVERLNKIPSEKKEEYRGANDEETKQIPVETEFKSQRFFPEAKITRKKKHKVTPLSIDEDTSTSLPMLPNISKK